MHKKKCKKSAKKMRVKVQGGVRLKGEVNAPPSKSYTHRAVAVAALAEGKSEVLFPLVSEDTKATFNAAECLGAVVEYDESARRLRVRGVAGKPRAPEDVLNAENSGTTLRFFTAISGLCSDPATAVATVLTGDASLRTRPNAPLLKSLNELGSEAYSTKGDGTAPLVVKGGLKGGETTLDGSVSSQFVSALLLACPLAERDTHILAKNLASVPYTKMTLEVLEQAGVEIPFSRSRSSGSGDFSFQVAGGRKYELRRFVVPGDFSSASYLLAAAAVTDSEVRVRNLFPSAQGDARIVEVLKEMGVEVKWEKERGVVSVRGRVAEKGKLKLKGLKVELRENPDLVPTVAVLGALAEGMTEITGVAHLRYKETDRLRLLTEELGKMGARVEERQDGLLVAGKEGEALKPAKVNSHGDHRLAMALCVAGLSASAGSSASAGAEETVVEGAECAKVSYPSFFEDLVSLGVSLGAEVKSEE